MRTWILNGHLLDPMQGMDGIYDLLIEDGKVAEIIPADQKKEQRKKKIIKMYPK